MFHVKQKIRQTYDNVVSLIANDISERFTVVFHVKHNNSSTSKPIKWFYRQVKVFRDAVLINRVNKGKRLLAGCVQYGFSKTRFNKAEIYAQNNSARH